jgi:hypothetical protein
MNGFLQLSKKTQSLNLIQILEQVLDSMHGKIVILIQEQLAEGKKGDDSLLPKYTPFTIRKKLEDSSIIMGERIALIDEGDFWRGMFAVVEGGSIFIDSTDFKSEMLIDRYGEEIFQMSSESLKSIVSEVFPEFKKRVNDYING